VNSAAGRLFYSKSCGVRLARGYVLGWTRLVLGETAKRLDVSDAAAAAAAALHAHGAYIESVFAWSQVSTCKLRRSYLQLTLVEDGDSPESSSVEPPV
jgi:hypothetical protein